MANNPDELMLALAYALEKWSRIEMGLSGLFEVLSDIPTQKKAHALFDTIISFEARLDVVSTLMGQEGLAELDLETWKRCAVKLSKLYQKRHGLAHFSLVDNIREGGKHDFEISPFLTFGKFSEGGWSCLQTQDIKDRGDKFAELSRVLTWFRLDAEARRGLHEGNPMQEIPPLLHLRALAAQTLEERANKQKPSAE